MSNILDMKRQAGRQAGTVSGLHSLQRIMNCRPVWDSWWGQGSKGYHQEPVDKAMQSGDLDPRCSACGRTRITWAQELKARLAPGKDSGQWRKRSRGGRGVGESKGTKAKKRFKAIYLHQEEAALETRAVPGTSLLLLRRKWQNPWASFGKASQRDC